MRDVTLVILNSLIIKCHIRRPLKVYYDLDSPNLKIVCSSHQ